ncbi:porin family protein [Bacteroidales bacterium OttesenSCG-928-M11]|nr:porin family protein [Bacteroidales bacterium OttesenSCG-928-M11]
MKVSKIIWIVFCLYFCSTAVAQEYKYEIGFAGGGAMYMGDANQDSYFQGWNPSVGVIFRNNINFRWALKADLLWGKVSGDTKNTDNVFPNKGEASFERNFYELGAQMEFNFLPYSDKYPYLNTSKISPYALMGGGVTLAPDNKTFFNLNLAMGIGVKYKIKNKLNLGLEYTVHKLFGDGLDAPNKDGFNLDNPYNIDDGFSKNKDWYNTLLFSITWEFGVRDTRCM